MSETISADFFELGQFEIDTRTVRLLESNTVAKLHMPPGAGVFEAKVPSFILRSRCSPRRAHVDHVSKSLSMEVIPVQLNAYEITKAIDVSYTVVRSQPRSELRLTLRRLQTPSIPRRQPMV